MTDPRLQQLAHIVGAANLLTAAADRSAYEVDHRRLYHGRALAVAAPRDVPTVARLVRWCHDNDVGVVPQGGNTGYCGGATPDDSGKQLVLSLQHLNRVRQVDTDNFSMTVEAGCILANVQAAAVAADRFFPLSLGSEGSCQIGGNLATNAGGLNVVRYGMMRELVLGIEAVLPDGSLLQGLKSLRKDNTGYDLKSLLIGSEGTLGVITAATLKLWPRIRSTATALAAIASPADAIALLGELRARSADRLSSFELLPQTALDLVKQYVPGSTIPDTTRAPWYLLCELSSTADEPLDEMLGQALRPGLEQGRILDAVLATSDRQRARVLAPARKRPGRPAPGRRQHQTRHRRAGGRPAAIHQRGLGLGGEPRARWRPRVLRPCRRRQPALQRQRGSRRPGNAFSGTGTRRTPRDSRPRGPP